MLISLRCSHRLSVEGDTGKENLTLFPFSNTKIFGLGSSHYQMCLFHVQTSIAIEPPQKIDSVNFIHNIWYFLSYTYWSQQDLSHGTQILILNPGSKSPHFHSPQILHFSEMVVTALTALKQDAAGTPNWQMQFYWCYAAQDVQSYYVSRDRKCNLVSECTRRKESFRVQGKCHYF